MSRGRRKSIGPKWCAAAAFMLLVAGNSSTALADPDLAAAGRAFAQGQSAELAGNWEQAASMYELALSIAPSPEGYRSALKARREAGHPARAATHALELLRRYPTDEVTREIADSTLSELAPETVRVKVLCQPSPCSVTADGRALGTEARQQHELVLMPGPHRLVARFGSRSTDPQTIDQAAGTRLQIPFQEPAPEVAPSAPISAPAPVPKPAPAPSTGGDSSSTGLSPVFPVVGIAVTAILGGITIWSGLDTLHAHDEYEQAPTEERYDDGTKKELRTNLLLGITGAAAAATIVLALATDWDGDPKTTAKAMPSIEVGDEGATLTYRGTF